MWRGYLYWSRAKLQWGDRLASSGLPQYCLTVPQANFVIAGSGELWSLWIHIPWDICLHLARGSRRWLAMWVGPGVFQLTLAIALLFWDKYMDSVASAALSHKA